MKIAFLGSESGWYFHDLQRVCSGQHQLIPVEFESLATDLGDGHSQVWFAEQNANDFDLVLVRVMPPGSLEQVVFRMDALLELQHNGTKVMNGPKTIEAAVDKYLCLAKLSRAGIPVPPTRTCENLEQAIDLFDQFAGDVLLKPLFGGEGRGIVRINDRDLLYRSLRAIETFRGVIYLQKFIQHAGFDLRIFVLGDEVFAMKRQTDGKWKTNISAGAIGSAYTPTDEEISLGRQAAKAIDATIAGVDIIRDAGGAPYVLEVNAVPGWKGLAQATGIDIAERVIKFLDLNNC
jgi:ribosomal protein S6--L-glutamate ligase